MAAGKSSGTLRSRPFSARNPPAEAPTTMASLMTWHLGFHARRRPGLRIA
jgi:hypothetical protein